MRAPLSLSFLLACCLLLSLSLSRALFLSLSLLSLVLFSKVGGVSTLPFDAARRISSGRGFITNTLARGKLLHTWIVSVVAK